MDREVLINFDLENSPLYIKTDSGDKSGDKLAVRFYFENTDSGGITIYFYGNDDYLINHCSTSTAFKFATDRPSAIDRVWKISLIRTSGIGNFQATEKVQSNSPHEWPIWINYPP